MPGIDKTIKKPKNKKPKKRIVGNKNFLEFIEHSDTNFDIANEVDIS